MAFLIEASRCVTNGIPLGCPLLLPVHTVNCIQTLKASFVGNATILVGQNLLDTEAEALAELKTKGNLTCREMSMVKLITPLGVEAAEEKQM
jgi:hypothetical protein